MHSESVSNVDIFGAVKPSAALTARMVKRAARPGDVRRDFKLDDTYDLAEAFVKTIKRDYVYVSDLSDAHTVMEQLPLWFKDYNENAPHKGLRMPSPDSF